MHGRTLILLLFSAAAAIGGCGRDRTDVATVPVSEETCLDCHDAMSGFSPFHEPAAIGCVSCHLGVPTDTTEEGSHRGMVAVPGNLSDAEETCGLCHEETVHRVQTSLMATGRGIVAVNRFVFGEQETPDGTDGLADLGKSHADEHLRQLCSTCHLGNVKVEPAPVTELSRGGGCVACHIAYEHERSDSYHPKLTAQVTDDHCFGCHSRSSRISLNYAGWHETLLPPAQMPDGPDYRLLDDGRVFVRETADVHHEAGMACIDCHTSRETMGDGEIYLHQEQALEVECSTCHFQGPAETVAWDELDPEAVRALAVRYGRSFPEREFLEIEKVGRALTNAFLDEDGVPVLEGKLDRERRPLKPPVEACFQPGHERVTCQGCHTDWVPQCVGCHTQLDPDGLWQEFASDFHADPPVLGVRTDEARDREQIQPFAPGMVLTINAERRPLTLPVEVLQAQGTFRRLHAPQVPHTTVREGRSCESCHLDPLALGYGRGQLTLDEGGEPSWQFAPEYELLRDGLPADAWIPFLGEAREPSTTRTTARPFNPDEQERILRVGACLTCHPHEEWVSLYQDFDQALANMTPACRVPH